MKPHSYINSNPAGWDSNCAVCGGKHRDSIHGETEEIRARNADRAKEINAAQVAADRLHHEQRVKWLSQPSPCYSDGYAVEKHVAARLLTQSRAALADKTGMVGLNSFHA